MNKKITIETHPIEKIILAAFLSPFVVLGYILFFCDNIYTCPKNNRTRL